MVKMYGHYRLLILFLDILLALSIILFLGGGVNLQVAVLISFMNVIGAPFLPYRNFVLPQNDSVLAAQFIGVIGYILITIILTTFFYRLLRGIDIKASLAQRKATRLKKHIILSPINSFSIELASDLQEKGLPFILVDKSKRKVINALNGGFVAVEADLSKDAKEVKGYFDGAKMLVLLGDNDIENVLITITAKKNVPRIKILARVKREEDMDRVLHSGVSYAVMPEIAVGDEIGDFMLKVV